MAVATVLREGGIQVVRWVLTSADPIGDAIAIPYHTDMCIQAEGTIGTATYAFQGHNHTESATGTFMDLTTIVDTAITGTTLPIVEQVGQAPFWVRPNLTTPGAGASVTFTLKATRSR